MAKGSTRSPRLARVAYPTAISSGVTPDSPRARPRCRVSRGEVMPMRRASAATRLGLIRFIHSTATTLSEMATARRMSRKAL